MQKKSGGNKEQTEDRPDFEPIFESEEFGDHSVVFDQTEFEFSSMPKCNRRPKDDADVQRDAEQFLFQSETAHCGQCQHEEFIKKRVRPKCRRQTSRVDRAQRVNECRAEDHARQHCRIRRVDEQSEDAGKLCSAADICLQKFLQ